MKKAGFVDDGRTVASMNVDGMPWFSLRNKGSGDRGSEFGIRNSEFGINTLKKDAGFDAANALPPVLTRREKLAFAYGVLKAALLAAVVFIGALLAFILFCTEIWFR